jgi:hypothetical protein
MACGYIDEVLEAYWTSCWAEFSYPCGIKWCTATFSYPCGIKWCKKWGIPYPCGIKTCTGTFPYPCDIIWCKGHMWYPCRKWFPTKELCYDFTSVREDCWGFYGRLIGCCDGREYKITRMCFGYLSGVYHTSKKVCGFEVLDDSGPCTEGQSIPPGGNLPVAPPGTVAGAGSLSSGIVNPNAHDCSDTFSRKGRLTRKLGSCPKCMRLSALCTIVSWLLYFAAISMSFKWLGWVLLAPTILFSALSAAHALAFALKPAIKRLRWHKNHEWQAP